MKLYLLHNGVSVRLMVITGYSATPTAAFQQWTEAMRTIRRFFAQGMRAEVYEVSLSPEATQTIAKAAAFCRERMSIVEAISELLNFCMTFAERKPFDMDGLAALVLQSNFNVELV